MIVLESFQKIINEECGFFGKKTIIVEKSKEGVDMKIKDKKESRWSIRMMFRKWKPSLMLGATLLLALFVMQVFSMATEVQSPLPSGTESSSIHSLNLATKGESERSLITQGVNVIIDGQIGQGEYQVRETLWYDAARGEAFWMYYTIDRANGMLYMAIIGRGLGWVSIGFNWVSANRMQGADIIIGYYDDNSGQTVVQDNYGTGKFSHAADTSLGGTEDILEKASSQNATDTILEFRRSLDTGDQYDFPISGGTTTGLMWAYHLTADDLVSEHDVVGTFAGYTFKAVPAAPQNVQATVVSSTQVDLTWTAPTDDGGDPIVQYRVYRSTTSGSGYVEVGTSTTASFSDTSVAPGNTYYYLIAAENGVGIGLNSTEISVTMPGPPSAPQSLSGQAGNGWVYLTWQAPADDGGSAITQYLIYRATIQGGPYTNINNVSASVLAYNDTSVANGQSYYYVVKAENAYGVGPASNEVAVTPGGVPSQPRNVTAQTGNGWVYLSWSAPADDGGFPIKYYLVYRSVQSGSGYAQVANVTTISYNDTGLTNGQTYYYKVSAVNALGEGANSTEVSAMPVGPPSAPQSLSSQSGVGWIYLTWQAPANDGGSAITQYLIYRATTQGGPYTNINNVSASVLAYNDTSVANGQSYYYVVKAENAYGVGPASNEIKATAGAVPSQPLNVTTQHGDGWIYLTWNPPADTGGSQIKYYLVYRTNQSGSGYVQVANVTTTSYNDTGLTNGQAYYYVITAVNDDGEGPFSQEVSDIPGTIPQPPTNLKILEVGNRSLTLTWDPPSDTGGYPITEYKIYRSTTSGGPYSYIGNTTTTSYTDTNLTNGQTYYYVVKAINQEGESVYSSEVFGTPMTVPSPPRNLTAIAGDGFVLLTWDPPQDDGGTPIELYMIYRSNSSSTDFVNIINTTQTSYNDTSVSNDQEYLYYVLAVNTMGASSPSPHVNATPTSSDSSDGSEGGTTTTPTTTTPTTTTPTTTTPTASNETQTAESESPTNTVTLPEVNVFAPELLTTAALAVIFIGALLAPFAIVIVRRMQS